MEAELFINGEKIGSTLSVNPKIEYNIERKAIKSGDNIKLMSFDYDRTITMDLENVQFNHDLFDSLMMHTPYTVKGTGYKLPRGVKLPKKKRIREKWKKRYGHDFEIYECYIR